MALAKHYDKEVEAKWQRQWEQDDTYRFAEEDTQRPIYSIDTPPPFTSGDLHMGHVLSYSYFDFVARYKRMRGFNVYYPQGWDCQGFPTEVRVEKKYGKLPRAAFREKCVSWTGEFIAKMRGQMNAMGFSPDWRYEYRTMDPDYWRRVQYSLLKMHEKDLVYRAEHPVFWCTHCHSALAKTDTVEMPRTTKLHYLKFKHLGKGAKGQAQDLLIATSRPEYLHACVAVLFHPEDKRYAGCKADEVETPLGKKVPFLPDSDVDMEFGSGVVMLCTFGDKQDVVWMYRHNLPAIRAMDGFGKLTNAGEFDGLNATEARRRILEKLDAEGKVAKAEPLEQIVKVHDRCQTPVELLLSTQWFIKVKDKADEIIAAAKQMRWVPDFSISYLVDWAENVEWDWVISRQRNFGTPLPFWYCKKCGKNYPARYDELPVNPPEMEPRQCSCGETLTPEEAVCDCWADSSITPLIIGRWPEDEKFFSRVYPSSLRPQGVEIIRTWAYYTIYRCFELTGQPCFRELLLNGNVLAPDGKKMSKSLGNIIAPDELISKYSADAVRTWSALSGAMAKDRPFSYQDMQYAKNFLNKLWNASKLAAKSLEGYAPREEDARHLRTLDKWVLSRLQKLIREVTEDFDNFQFHHALKLVQEFFWHEVCDNYLEAIKYRLYQPENFGEGSKRAAQYILYHVWDTVLKLLAPVNVFITEEIYQELFPGKAKSVHLSSWPQPQPAFLNDGAEETAAKFNALMAEIRQHKASKQLALNSELESVVVSTSTDLSSVEEELKQAGKVKSITWQEGSEDRIAFP